jgi:hypothetical protein
MNHDQYLSIIPKNESREKVKEQCARTEYIKQQTILQCREYQSIIDSKLDINNDYYQCQHYL